MFAREKWWPAATAVGASGLYSGCSYLLRREVAHIPPNSHEIFVTAVTVAGIAIAFIAALQGILFALGESRIIERLRELDVYDQLLRYFSSAINAGMLCIVLSSAGLFFNAAGATWKHRAFFLVWIWSSTLAAATCFRITRLFAKIVHS